MMEPLLVSNNLYRNGLSCGMISAAQHLTKGAFSETARDLVTVTEMIMVDDEIVTAVIIIPVIVRRPVVLGQMLSLTALEDGFKGVNR